MIELDDKENQSPVIRDLGMDIVKSPSASPAKAGKKKARSRSIGPGGLEELDAPKQQHQSPDRNRRKSAFPTVKSILPSKEDEAKRREARRKSLANRRVSFAPEATLHTWDVIEYMRDATTSSASSELPRRPSSAYEGPDSDAPSTSSDQEDDYEDSVDSPEHQRDAHQQKRRRSSAIPPMNFNSLDQDFSSSPVSGSSDAAASSDVEEDVDDSEDEGDSTAMSLDQGDNTMASQESASSTGSSARLDAALRQASNQAGTRGIEFDEYGDMSMEMAGDEITNAFKPWSNGQHFPIQDQENVNPFSPAFSRAAEVEDDEGDDMSMDITRAMGGIIPQRQPQQQNNNQEDDGDMTMDMTRPVGAIWSSNLPRQQEPDDDEGDEDRNDMTMDMTRPVGGILSQRPQFVEREATVSFGDETMDFTQAMGAIHQPNPTAQPPRSALKRKQSAITTDEGSPLTSIKSSTRESQRRTVATARDAKRRRSSGARLSLGDGTMDLTFAVSGIRQPQSPARSDRRESLRSRRSSAASSAMDEQTMEFTTAIGGIRQAGQPFATSAIEEENSDDNEDMSMEFTAVLGRIQQQAEQDNDKPATPRQSLSPARSGIPTTPKDQDRFKEAQDLSAKKLLTPLFEKEVPESAVKDSAGSRRSSARKTPLSHVSAKSPGFLSPAVLDSVRKSSASSKKLPSSALKSPRSAQKPLNPLPKSPSVQATPSSVKRMKFTQDTPLPHNSPVPAAGTPTSIAKSAASKASSRKSPASVRRSARKSLAIVQPYEDKPAEQSVLSLDVPSKQEPKDEEMTNASQSTPQLPSSQPEQPSFEQSMDDIKYPVLPVPEPETSNSPQISHTPSAQPPVHHPAVSMTGSPMRISAVSTPKQIDIDDLNPLSPSLEKQMRTSPVKFASTPEQRTSEEPSKAAFADSIKLMTTPRKDSGTSPLKRLRNLTPKKSPVKKGMTPRKAATPKLRTPPTLAQPSAGKLVDLKLTSDLFAAPKTEPETKRVHINEFLDLAGIKFMDLTATKRRHTIAPTPESSRTEGHDQTVDLEGAVVAGACTIPMLELFQHACHELKRYISEGKSFLKTLEAEVYEEPPPFFQAYVGASPESKAKLDGHMRDIKTNARLRSKEIWYDWRGKLLDGLEDGLNRIKDGLESDASNLGEKERALESVLPDLLQHYENLQREAEQLEEAAAATSEEEKEELRASRERLIEVDRDIEERKRMLASLQQDIDEQENLTEAYTEGKVECLAAIQEAERVKESYRGWTIDEVQALKASVTTLEKQTGWAITSASGSNLTMTYENTLQLFFNTLSFPLISGTSASKQDNSPISLTYIGNSSESTNTSPLTTEKRFFLQLMRAQLQCLDQSSTSIKSLLDFVSGGWNTSIKVAEQVRRLNLSNMVSAGILSDEQLGINIDILLPKVESKVRVTLKLTTAAVEGEQMRLGTEIEVQAKVVYGEAYNERNMAEFVGKRFKGGFEGWDDTVKELRDRLVVTGRKAR